MDRVKWLSAEQLCSHLVYDLLNFAPCSPVSQVWRVTRTSSSSCRGETSSRSAPHPGRRPVTTDFRRIARPCGTNRKKPSGQSRPVSAVPASQLHVCETRQQNLLDTSVWCCGGYTSHLISSLPVTYTYNYYLTTSNTNLPSDTTKTIFDMFSQESWVLPSWIIKVED